MDASDFEWDTEKAEINARSHGITFELAQKAFVDPGALWLEDTDSSWGEDRYRLVGYAGGRILVLSYTYRGDLIRLISARPATKRERDAYNRGQTSP